MSGIRKVRVGVLALQGAFQAHQPHIESLNAEYIEVINNKDFEKIDGLILPGGESGTMLKLIQFVGIKDALKEFMKTRPAWGICAGGILMAQKVYGPEQESLSVINIEVTRNAYGRQQDSFEEFINDYKVSYIRAPKISKTDLSVQVLGSKDESPTWIESGLHMVTTFHPETNLNYG
ncbi:MAG: pyridoxal 5'-phosphate synthase glutaminase subunit PdxT, partial [Moraxellaceae bacterium]|nr:pyridoxal 5'-phosphate synthase glutaminase subunit PdxT [Pseudobdellovibrionaceae bacterium]